MTFFTISQMKHSLYQRWGMDFVGALRPMTRWKSRAVKLCVSMVKTLTKFIAKPWGCTPNVRGAVRLARCRRRHSGYSMSFAFYHSKPM
jgi:hypothetical protein